MNLNGKKKNVRLIKVKLNYFLHGKRCRLHAECILLYHNGRNGKKLK